MSPSLLLLAAGGSSRMGRPKQLLSYRGTTLLRHAAGVALASRCASVTVVLGAQSSEMRTELAGLPLTTIDNPAWRSGMGSSIRAGLAAVLAGSAPPAVLIMLCDQPAVTPELLNLLIGRHATDPAPIVACEYDGIAGVPALFDASLFTELQNLPDSAGARHLIQQHATQVARIPFPQGANDVDTPEDYDRLH